MGNWFLGKIYFFESFAFFLAGFFFLIFNRRISKMFCEINDFWNMNTSENLMRVRNYILGTVITVLGVYLMIKNF